MHLAIVEHSMAFWTYYLSHIRALVVIVILECIEIIQGSPRLREAETPRNAYLWSSRQMSQQALTRATKNMIFTLSAKRGLYLDE
jgi:hypothetical protein